MDDIGVMADKYPKKDEPQEKSNKWKIALIATVLAIVLFSSYIYKFTNNLFGDKINIAEDGVPTIQGMLIHGIVFFIILRIILW